MSWVADQSFDRVVMALVLHHLHDPRTTLRELHRVLRDDGRLVLSTVHPFVDWRRPGGSYFTDERVQETWRGSWNVNFRRAPLTAITEDFTATGFAIESMVEPRPADSMLDEFPEVHETLTNEPGFIISSSRVREPSRGVGGPRCRRGAGRAG